MSELVTSKKMLVWLSWTKVTAIVMVIVLHVNAAVVASLNQGHWPLTNAWLEAIAVMAVPLFVMASGYGLLDKQEPAHIFFRKRMSRILWPWLFWSLVSLAIFVVTAQRLGFSGLLSQLMEIMIGQSWFMPMITGLYLMTPWLRVLLKRIKTAGLIAAVTVLFFFFSLLNFFLKWTDSPYQFYFLNRVLFLPFSFLLYYLLGFITKKYLTNLKFNIFYLFLITITAIVTISSLMGNKFIVTLQPSLALDYLSPHIVIQSFICFLLISGPIGKVLPNFNLKISTMIGFITPQVLSIYLVNRIVMNLFFSSNMSQALNKIIPFSLINVLLISGGVLIISLVMAMGFEYFTRILKR